ncbi:MAG TPA: hypothetical protein VGZ69_07130 [Candidatus Rhabdochlamydia sp.]|jgi:hypothetical protein|nr:hypothetical protein [Candidatus Rhabdochlamydia sp.]
MRRLSLRLKKLKQNLGVVHIMCPFAHGSGKEQIAEARRKAEEKYLSEGGDPYRTRIFFGIVEYGPTVGESKWYYPS